MKLVNIVSKKAYPMDKKGSYTLFHGELSLNQKEQSISWECQAQETEAVYLGAPKIEVLATGKGDPRLLEECLISIEIDGEPTLKMAQILKDHQRLSLIPGMYCSFEASENDERCGIFVTNGAVIKAIVLAPKIIPVGIRLKITLGAELYKGAKK